MRGPGGVWDLRLLDREDQEHAGPRGGQSLLDPGVGRYQGAEVGDLVGV